MMPLTFMSINNEVTIQKVKGKEDVRRFLAGIGITEGQQITIVTKRGKDLILSVKNSRIAINREMASLIMVG